MRRRNGYVKLGLTVFLTVSSILLFYDTLFGHRVILHLWSQFLHAVAPILLGAFFAYLLAPVVDYFDEIILSVSRRHPVSRQHPAADSARLSRGARAVSILLTWIVICFLGYLLASVLLPELYRSILQLVNNAENYYITIRHWVNHLLETNPELDSWMSLQLETYYQDLSRWLTDNVLPQAETLMQAISGGIKGTLNFLKNLLVGAIASVYLLYTKESCAAYARKAAYGLFSPSSVEWVLRGSHRVDVIFSGFVRGKLLDSLIIGIICFVCCSILKFPYTPLVSVIVGVTNIIPFFGPFLGAIPSFFLILLAKPIKALYFALFVLVLQQVDGNIIGPKILGDKTGLSSLWVIIAILVGGSFFGIPGMFFGVPVCACLHSAVNFFINSRLRKRDLPVETSAYASASIKKDPPFPGSSGEDSL